MKNSTVKYSGFLSKNIKDGWILIQCYRDSFYLSTKYLKDKKILLPESMIFRVEILNIKERKVEGVMNFTVDISNTEMLSKVFMSFLGNRRPNNREIIGISHNFFKGARCYVNIKKTSQDSGELVNFKPFH